MLVPLEKPSRDVSFSMTEVIIDHEIKKFFKCWNEIRDAMYDSQSVMSTYVNHFEKFDRQINFNLSSKELYEKIVKPLQQLDKTMYELEKKIKKDKSLIQQEYGK